MDQKFSKFFWIFINFFKICCLILFVYPCEKFKISKFGFTFAIINFFANFYYHRELVFKTLQNLLFSTQIINKLFHYYVAYQSVVIIMSCFIIFFSQKRIFNMLKKMESFMQKSHKINSKTNNFNLLIVIFTSDLILKNLMHRNVIGTLFYILFDAPIYFYIFVVFTITYHIENIEKNLR